MKKRKLPNLKGLWNIKPTVIDNRCREDPFREFPPDGQVGVNICQRQGFGYPDPSRKNPSSDFLHQSRGARTGCGTFI